VSRAGIEDLLFFGWLDLELVLIPSRPIFSRSFAAEWCAPRSVAIANHDAQCEERRRTEQFNSGPISFDQ
jgi:hypothetical protein